MELLNFAKVLISALRRRKITALTVFLLVSGVAVSVAMVTKARYEAEALLLVGNGILVGNGVNEQSASGSVVDPNGINSLAQLAVTDDVLRAAAIKVGFERLFPNQKASRYGNWAATMVDFLRTAAAATPDLLRAAAATAPEFLRTAAEATADFLRTPAAEAVDFVRAGLEHLFPDLYETHPKEGALILNLRRATTARAEGKSDVLRVSFRHRDPAIAAEFVNALVDGLVVRQAELLNVPDSAVIFFERQKKRLEDEVQKAATALQNFSLANDIYSIDDQRGLLLKQANDIAASIVSTHGSILERTAQKEVLADQLRMMKPATLSPAFTPILGSSGTNNGGKNADNSRKRPAEERTILADPPLLLVHVYQDTVAALFRVNAELAGENDRETHLRGELQRLNMELAALTSKQAEHNRLERELALAVNAAEAYAKRATEGQINASLAKARVSSVRIAQLANGPERPVFPQPSIVLALGLLGAVVLASAAAVLPDALHGVDKVEPAHRQTQALHGPVREASAGFLTPVILEPLRSGYSGHGSH